jgi:hypothetical protein
VSSPLPFGDCVAIGVGKKLKRILLWHMSWLGERKAAEKALDLPAGRQGGNLLPNRFKHLFTIQTSLSISIIGMVTHNIQITGILKL